MKMRPEPGRYQGTLTISVAQKRRKSGVSEISRGDWRFWPIALSFPELWKRLPKILEDAA